jgi:hypothetical protein
MKGAPRAFRLACHAAVVAWAAAILSGSFFEARFPANAAEWVEAEEPATPAEAVARIRPVPEAVREEPPPEKVARTEPAKPEPVAAGDLAEPVTADDVAEPVAAGDVARGVALLDDGGTFPVLSCSYESFPSFLAYARAMASLGARFVVVRRREIVGSIDIETGAIDAAAVGGASARGRW